MEDKYIGVVEDPRSEEEQSKDWKVEDFFGSSERVWKERGKTKWMKPLYIRNQDGSSQCMAYSGAKHLGINDMRENGDFVNLSPTFIYQKRAVKAEGMYMQNLLDIMVKHGSPKDDWFPCDDLGEDEINNAPLPSESVIEEALKYRGQAYVQTPAFDIDRIAQAIDTSGSCIIIIRCNIKEWTEYPFIDPKVTQADWNVNHAVCCMQYGKIDGKRHILVEDSWGSRYGKNGQRWLSEDFIKERMFAGGYVIDLANPDITPKYNFKTDLKLGMVSSDVKMLQKILILEDCMTEAQASTGWGIFGQRTHNAVKQLQEKYATEILKPVGLTKGTGYVGKSTREFLNKKWG